ncbi:MAG: glucose-1-phosphate thymidylyltransferase [Thermodesulfatator sp.]|nr:MAG: glucose-1-phosphate thymidylyltransferase [Thermodesulfatator sp.]
MSLSPTDYFDLTTLTRHRTLFEGLFYVWEVLERLADYLREHLQPLPPEVPLAEPLREGLVFWEGEFLPFSEVKIFRKGRGFRILRRGEELSEAALVFPGAVFMDREVGLSPGVVVEPGALLYGPTLLGPGTEVRQGAYVRGEVLTGEGCVIGHTTEVKRALFLDRAKAGHFAYVGDSLLGREVNLGAGTKLANLRLTRGTVRVRVGGQEVDTGLRKLGAVLGDGVQTGCNSVTNPGTFLGPGSLVLPNVTVGPGVFPARSVIKK